MAAPHRQHRECRHAGELLQLLRAGREQTGVPTKAVQHEVADQRAFVGRQQLMRAEQVSGVATAVDVADEQARGLRFACGAHVGVVARVQVDLGRRAGALDHDQLVLAQQRVQRIGGKRPERLSALAPRHACQIGTHLAEHDDLARGIALGLEQHRVHAHLGLGRCRQPLKIQHAADLAQRAVQPRHGARVVPHVLGLERRDLQALARTPAAQRGRVPALAGVAGGAEHHYRAPGHAALTPTAGVAAPSPSHAARVPM